MSQSVPIFYIINYTSWEVILEQKVGVQLQWCASVKSLTSAWHVAEKLATPTQKFFVDLWLEQVFVCDAVCRGSTLHTVVQQSINFVNLILNSEHQCYCWLCCRIVWFPVTVGVIVYAGRVWAGSVQEDVGVETMGTSGGRASCQPMEMAHLNRAVCSCHTVCVCSIPLLLLKFCTN